MSKDLTYHYKRSTTRAEKPVRRGVRRLTSPSAGSRARPVKVKIYRFASKFFHYRLHCSVIWGREQWLRHTVRGLRSRWRVSILPIHVAIGPRLLTDASLVAVRTHEGNSLPPWRLSMACGSLVPLVIIGNMTVSGVPSPIVGTTALGLTEMRTKKKSA